MKKFIISMVIISSLVGITIPASAMDAQEAATAATVLVSGSQYAYEANIILEALSRPGGKTLDGAKGIVFEIMYRNKKNLQNAFKSGKATLSEIKNDPVADLKIKDRFGEVLEKIQCKDGTSSSHISQTAQQVQAGKYSEATLVGTTEFAESFNSFAESHGIKQLAVDSGISTKKTSQIAERLLGQMPKIKTLLEASGKATGQGALLGGVLALIESLHDGSDLSKTIAHTMTGSGEGALTFGLYPIVVNGTTALLATASAPAAATVIAPVVVGIMVSSGAEYILCKSEKVVKLELVLSNLINKIGKTITDGYEGASDFIARMNISEHASNAWDATVSAVSNTGRTIASTTSKTGKKVYNAGASGVEFIKDNCKKNKA